MAQEAVKAAVGCLLPQVLGRSWPKSQAEALALLDLTLAGSSRPNDALPGLRRFVRLP